MEEIDFGDLEPVKARVKIKGEWYVIAEASGAAAVKYHNAVMRAAQLKRGGDDKLAVESWDGLADSEPVLVAACLTHEDGKSVSVGDVLAWPARVQKRLYEWVKAHSPGLSDEDAGQSKNGQGAGPKPTTASSA